jgi:threonine/homoserine efflux transporter RhtA
MTDLPEPCVEKWPARWRVLLIVGVYLAFWAGVAFAAYLMTGAHAEPVFLTRQQQVDVVRIAQGVSNRIPHASGR